MDSPVHLLGSAAEMLDLMIGALKNLLDIGATASLKKALDGSAEGYLMLVTPLDLYPPVIGTFSSLLQ